MNQIRNLIINEARNESLSYFCAKVCILLLPLHVYFLPPIIILWIIARCQEIYFNAKSGIHMAYSSKGMRILAFLFAIFFCVQSISLIYTKNLATGINIISSRLLLMAVPILFISPGARIMIGRRNLLKYFVIGTVIYLLLCLGFAFLRSLIWEDGHFIFNPHPPEAYWFNYFFGSYFSFNQHPSYAAIFVVFSIVISLDFIFSLTVRNRFFWISSLILLIISLYLLSSRSGFIMGMAGISLFLFIKIKNFHRTIVPIILLIFLAIGSLYVIKSNERVKYYFDMSKNSMASANNKDGRVLIWNSAIDIIKENVLLGVGVGDVRDELLKKYRASGNLDLIKNRYNAHNQFLETAIEGGLLNLLVFLSIVAFSVYTSIINKNNLFGIYTLLLIIFFMSESVLYRFAGVAFFSILSFITLTGEEVFKEGIVDKK